MSLTTTQMFIIAMAATAGQTLMQVQAQRQQARAAAAQATFWPLLRETTLLLQDRTLMQFEIEARQRKKITAGA